VKRVVAVLALLWALGNVAIAYFFLTGAFTAKTVIKEGPPAQAVLLLLGILMVMLSILLARECLRLLRAPSMVET
jgi:hypothetical protein